MRIWYNSHKCFFSFLYQLIDRFLNMRISNLARIGIFSFIVIFWIGCQFGFVIAQNSVPQTFQDDLKIIIDEYLEANNISGTSTSISLDGYVD